MIKTIEVHVHSFTLSEFADIKESNRKKVSHYARLHSKWEHNGDWAGWMIDYTLCFVQSIDQSIEHKIPF